MEKEGEKGENETSEVWGGEKRKAKEGPRPEGKRKKNGKERNAPKGKRKKRRTKEKGRNATKGKENAPKKVAASSSRFGRKRRKSGRLEKQLFP